MHIEFKWLVAMSTLTFLSVFGFITVYAIELFWLHQSMALLQLVKDPTGLAKCLDGSSPAYYIQTSTTSNKWIIFLQGGGWCTTSQQEADEVMSNHCKKRLLTTKGSTNHLPKRLYPGNVADYLSVDPELNPHFKHWNKVIIPSCDGSSFTGGRKEPLDGVLMRGFFNFQATIKQLMSKHNMDRAQELVLAGCDSGGVGVLAHIERLQSLFPGKRVTGLVDSGFFLDSTALVPGPAQSFRDRMKMVFSDHQSVVPQSCAAAYGDSPYLCLMAEHVVPVITTPIFFIQSIYDKWQIQEESPAKDEERVNSYGSQIAKQFQSTVLSSDIPNKGAFLDSCTHHCNNWNSVAINGQTPASTYLEWYEALKQPGRKLGSNQSCSSGVCVEIYKYPCTQCCATTKEGKRMEFRSAVRDEAMGDYKEGPWGDSKIWEIDTMQEYVL